MDAYCPFLSRIPSIILWIFPTLELMWMLSRSQISNRSEGLAHYAREVDFLNILEVLPHVQTASDFPCEIGEFVFL
jgi:hypothetical protein